MQGKENLSFGCGDKYRAVVFFVGIRAVLASKTLEGFRLKKNPETLPNHGRFLETLLSFCQW